MHMRLAAVMRLSVADAITPFIKNTIDVFDTKENPKQGIKAGPPINPQQGL